MFTVAVAIFGIVSFTRLPLNLLPDISYPSLTVETRYQGAAPAEVESLLSRPIEEAVGVISGVKRLTSRSRAGISEVTLEFLWDTNMGFASLDVREKLDLVQLPRDADKPTLLRFDPSSDPILRLGINRDRDGEADDYRCPRITQKERDDEHREQAADPSVLNDLVDGAFDEARLVEQQRAGLCTPTRRRASKG